MNGERLIMNIEDIEKVTQKAPFSTIIASHMDTVSHLTITREDLREFKEKNLLKRLLIPDDGDVMVFNS